MIRDDKPTPQAATAASPDRLGFLALDLLENVTDGVFILDPGLTVLYLNAAAERLLEQNRLGVLGHTLFDSFSEAKGSIFEEQCSKAARERRFTTFETYFGVVPTKNWYDVRVYPIEAGIAVFLHVTTEIKLAQEALRASELRYKTVADFTYDWEAWTAPDGTYLYVSPSCERISGYPPSAFLTDKSFMENILVDEDMQVWRDHLAAVHSGGHSGEIVVRIKRPDGEIRHIGHACQPVTDEAGRYKGQRTSNRDITESVLASRRLAEQENLNRTLLDFLPAAITVTDLSSGEILYVNRKARELFEIEAADLSVAKASAFYNRPEDRAAFTGMLSIEDAAFQEMEMATATGRPFYAAVSAVLRTYRNVPAVYAVVQDVTESKRYQTALAESQELFAAFMDQMPAAIFMQDSNEGVFYANRYALDILGDGREWIGKRPNEIFGPEAGVKLARDWRTALAGTAVDTVDHLVSPAGHAATYRTLRFPIRRETGPAIVGGIALDITELTAIAALSRVVNEAVTMDEVADAAAQALIETLNVNLCVVYLKRGDMLEILVMRTRDIDFPKRSDLPHQVGECLCGRCATQQGAVFSLDIHSDPRCTSTECKQAGIVSFASLPLRVADDLPGIVSLGSTTKTDFAARTGFLESLSTVVSLGMHKAHLYESVRKQAAELDQTVTLRTAELTKANESLAEDEARYQSLIGTSINGFWAVDGAGSLIDVNDAYCAMSGFGREELLSMRIPDLEAMETPEETARHVETVIKNGSDVFESRHRRKDGSLFDVKISTTYVAQQNYFLCFLEDITPRKRAEEDLRRALSFNSMVLDHSPAGIAAYDAQTGRCVMANAVFANMIGATVEQARAQNFREIESWREAGLYDLAEKALATGQPQRGEIHRPSSFGKKVNLDCLFACHGDGADRVLLLVITDIAGRFRDVLQSETTEAQTRTAADAKARKEALDRLGGDEEMLDQLHGEFTASLAGRIANLRSALDSGDLSALRALAHNCKGVAFAVGEGFAGGLAAALESAAQKSAGVAPAFDALTRALESLTVNQAR